MTVLVFDSGIGGLSVLREMRRWMPGNRFVYLADDAGFPYGNRDERALEAHVLDVVSGAVARHAPGMIVVACNTASTVALPGLRARFGVPVVGTVPAIKPAAERTASARVTLLATPATVERAYTRALVRDFAADVAVTMVGAPRLAALAEEFLRSGRVDEWAVAAEIAPCFVEGKDGRRTDIVILGCTHYPFLTAVMRRHAPWPVDWLDPAESIALHARTLLPAGDGEGGPDLAETTSGRIDAALGRLYAGFGLKVVRDPRD